MDKMKASAETTGIDVDIANSVLSGTGARVGVSAGVTWMEAMGSGSMAVATEEGRMVEGMMVEAGFAFR